MASVFYDQVGVLFYKTQTGEDLKLCEAGYEACSPRKPCETMVIDYYALHYCISGEGMLQIGDVCRHIYPGDIFIIPPDTPNKYYVVPENPWNYRWIGLRGTAAEKVLADCGLTKENFFLCGEYQAELENYFENIYNTCVEQEDFKIMGNLYHLLDFLKTKQNTSVKSVLSGGEALCNELCHYIRLNYFHDINIASIAAEKGVDRTYIFKLFKKYKQTSPSQYLLSYRMNKACMLLRKTALSITDVGLAVGFQNIPHFSKQFTHQIGLSPSAYRKEFRP